VTSCKQSCGNTTHEVLAYILDSVTGLTDQDQCMGSNVKQPLATCLQLLELTRILISLLVSTTYDIHTYC
jgi:hypothetical protein